jgi:cold shock CspA family protein
MYSSFGEQQAAALERLSDDYFIHQSAARLSKMRKLQESQGFLASVK